MSDVHDDPVFTSLLEEQIEFFNCAICMNRVTQPPRLAFQPWQCQSGLAFPECRGDVNGFCLDDEA